ncbi:transposase [Paracoccus seriniphilus]|uniref:transposase n=1 Tax=Paracoccus seriniphilus TaxID=184748 RepID=UPI000B7730A9|nr:transposase [Paracoccus seriniphilus]
MPPRRLGRSCRQTYGDAANRTCFSIEVLFGIALQQIAGFVENLVKLNSLDWPVSNFSMLTRHQKILTVNIPHRGSTALQHMR